jgi:uncharacterized membrane protein YheB (UPF0754 family)
MLFRPRNPIRVAGLVLHGLVPKRQRQIAERIGALIERDLISHDDIRKVLESPETSAQASQFLSEQVDGFVAKLTMQNPMVGAFLQGPMLDQIKGILSKQIAERFPDFMGRVVERVEERLDIKELVTDKVNAFDLSKLESMIYEVSSRELKTIELLGGVLGFIVGLGQVGLLLVTR